MKHNVLVGASNFTNLVYADDTTLLPSADDASARLSSFTEATAPLDLIISWAKTKLQNLHSGMAPNSISVNSSNIESVEDFIYLRRLQSSNGCCSQDLKNRIGLASSVMASLHRIWKDQHLTLTTKLQVYLALVLSVLLDSYSNRHESIRGLPHEMSASDTRNSLVWLRQ